jgi:hypothetical protein
MRIIDKSKDYEAFEQILADAVRRAEMRALAREILRCAQNDSPGRERFLQSRLYCHPWKTSVIEGAAVVNLRKYRAAR